MAGFIGSPQMNFIDATISQKGDAFYLDFLNYSIPIPSDKGGSELFGPYVGKEIVFGIRPEDLHNNAQYIAEHKESVITAAVDLVELMGAETYVYMDCEGVRLMSRSPERFAGKHGDTASFAIDMEKIHLFDKKSEQAICH